MILTLYSEKDYSGDFNLLRSEKALIIKAIKKTREIEALVKILNIPQSRLLIAIIKHKIKI